MQGSKTVPLGSFRTHISSSPKPPDVSKAEKVNHAKYPCYRRDHS